MAYVYKRSIVGSDFHSSQVSVIKKIEIEVLMLYACKQCKAVHLQNFHHWLIGHK